MKTSEDTFWWWPCSLIQWLMDVLWPNSTSKPKEQFSVKTPIKEEITESYFSSSSIYCMGVMFWIPEAALLCEESQPRGQTWATADGGEKRWKVVGSSQKDLVLPTHCLGPFVSMQVGIMGRQGKVLPVLVSGCLNFLCVYLQEAGGKWEWKHWRVPCGCFAGLLYGDS